MEQQRGEVSQRFRRGVDFGINNHHSDQEEENEEEEYDSEDDEDEYQGTYFDGMDPEAPEVSCDVQ